MILSLLIPIKIAGGGYNREFDILLVINHNSINTLKIAKTILAKRRIATFSQTLMLKNGIFFVSKIERFINPYWRQSHMEIQRYINLVREIDHKIFDKNYHFIDFNQIRLKTSKIHKDYIDKVLQNIKYKKYDKIIGICPFSQTSMRKDMNFNLNEWLKIVNILSNKFQNYLFLILSYPKANNFDCQKNNVFVFKNNNDLLNLVEITSRLDLLLSSDTGNVHIADNLKIPTLEIISKKKYNQWRGGWYGGYCKAIPLPYKWNKNKYKDKYLDKFISEAILILNKL